MASERGPADPLDVTGMTWKGQPQRVTAPYRKLLEDISSRAGHVKSCLKIGGPPPKAKYSLLTDSEPVP